MILHLIRIEYLMDQHQATDSLTNGYALWCIDDTCVPSASCSQAQKVGVLRKNDTPLPRGKRQMDFISCAARVRFSHTKHIDAALAQSPNNSVGNMFISVKADGAHDLRVLNFA